MSVTLATLCALGGCASPGPEALVTLNQPIVTALTTPESQLQRRAEQGEAQAQLALSVAQRRREAVGSIFADAAIHWRGRATAARGFTPLTLYVAGYKGHAARVSTTLIPRYEVTSVQVIAVDQCVAILSHSLDEPALNRALDKGVCGGRTNYSRLAALWAEPPATSASE